MQDNKICSECDTETVVQVGILDSHGDYAKYLYQCTKCKLVFIFYV